MTVTMLCRSDQRPFELTSQSQQVLSDYNTSPKHFYEHITSLTGSLRLTRSFILVTTELWVNACHRPARNHEDPGLTS